MGKAIGEGKTADEFEELRFLAEVRLGLEELDRGDGIPHENIEAMIDGWPSES